MSAAATPGGDYVFLQGSRMGGLGNRTLLFGEGDARRVLKVYRPRRHAPVEWLAELGATITHKVGRTARKRYETERAYLELWAREGFDVFQVHADPVPEEFGPYAIWLEYCEGRLLSKYLRDQAAPWEEKATLLARLGAEMGRRHRLALERNALFLVHGHGGLQHVMVAGDRLITFDFEGAWIGRYPVREALTRELATYMHSLGKNLPERFDDGLRAWRAGYGGDDLLKSLANWGACGSGLERRLWRWRQRRRQKRSPRRLSKGLALERLLASLRE